MNLKDIMTSHVEVVSPDATLKDAAKMMDDLDIGALPVCENDRLVGMITDRDIIIRSVAAGQDPNKAVVRDSMTSPIHYCLEDQSVEEVAKIMESKQIRRICVLNSSKRLCGIVSLGDLMASVTESVSQPTTTQKAS